jgi:hypothetical protein
MPWVGYEPTTPASERAKTVHALDRSATVSGGILVYRLAKRKQSSTAFQEDNFLSIQTNKLTN